MFPLREKLRSVGHRGFREFPIEVLPLVAIRTVRLLFVSPLRAVLTNRRYLNLVTYEVRVSQRLE